MRGILTTETQSHRGSENQRDPRTSSIISAAIDVVVVLELKCVKKSVPIDEAQLLTYLKLSGKRVGLLINFNVPLLTQGIIRRVL